MSFIRSFSTRRTKRRKVRPTHRRLPTTTTASCARTLQPPKSYQFSRKLKIRRLPTDLTTKSFTARQFWCGDPEAANSRTRCLRWTSLLPPTRGRPAKLLSFPFSISNKVLITKNAIKLLTRSTSGMEMQLWIVARRWFQSFPYTTMTHTRKVHPPTPITSTPITITITISIDILVKSLAKIPYGHIRILHMLFMHSTKRAPSEFMIFSFFWGICR